MGELQIGTRVVGSGHAPLIIAEIGINHEGSLATALASKGFIEPVVAAWLPHAGMAALAVWFFVRLR